MHEPISPGPGGSTPVGEPSGCRPTVAADHLEDNERLLRGTHVGWRTPDRDDRVSFDGTVWRIRCADGDCQLHSREPLREARRVVEDTVAARPGADWLIVVGLGLGYVLEALDERGWTGRVLAIEPEPWTIRPWLERRSWRGWLEGSRLRVVTGPSYEGVSDCRILAGDGSSEPLWLVSPVVDRIDPQARARAEALVARLRFEARANAQARREHGARYLLNTLRNVESLHGAATVDRLRDLTPGVPAVVVGAGPSLDLVVPLLRDARERAVIIAVDTALRPLAAAGIDPHLVVAVDPGEANVRHLVDLPPCPGAHLVAEGSVDPAAFATFRGRTFAFAVADHQPWPWLRESGFDHGRLRAWGSVLTCAFDLACVMGCDPIVFVGSDLAFTGGRPYARGITYEEDWRRLSEWGVPYQEQWTQQVETWPHVAAPDVAGEPARTAAHLVAFRDWLAEQAGRLGRAVINATGHGILHGSRIACRPLDALVREWPRRDDIAGRIAGSCRPTPGRTLEPARAMATALRDACGGTPVPAPVADLVSAWAAFADGVTVNRLAGALDRVSSPAVPAGDAPAPESAVMALDAEWMAPLARAVRMAPLTMATWQMERATSTVRRYRCRTSAGRMAACAMRVEEGAVAEDGVPLDSATWIDTVGPGQYYIWRDEVYFASRDGTDPRENGRRYTVIVPAFVAFLETLPAHDIQRLGL